MTPARLAIVRAPAQQLTRRPLEPIDEPTVAGPTTGALPKAIPTVPAPAVETAAAATTEQPQAVPPQAVPPQAVAPQALVSQPVAPAAGPAPMSTRQLSDEEVEKMRVHARHLLAIGDISGARLFLQRAIAAGCPVSTMTMAETYDPEFLAKNNVIGMAPNASIAKSYYKRALDAGNAEAEKRLERLH